MHTALAHAEARPHASHRIGHRIPRTWSPDDSFGFTTFFIGSADVQNLPGRVIVDTAAG